MKIVEVSWQDAACEHNELDLDKAPEINPIARKNVGYLVYQGEDKAIVCFGTVCDKDKNISCTSDTLVIPAHDIIEIKELT